MELKKYKLKDICLINDLNIRNLSKDSIIQYLDTSSITCGQIESLQTLKLKDAPSRAQRMVSNDTIVYSMVRPNLCHYGYIETPLENMVVSTGFITIRVKPEFVNLIDCRYLYLQLTRSAITLYLQDIAQNAVSAYPSLCPSDIENLCFDFPTLEEQKAMSSAIHNIDRKIALNREINRNLPLTA